MKLGPDSETTHLMAELACCRAELEEAVQARVEIERELLEARAQLRKLRGKLAVAEAKRAEFYAAKLELSEQVRALRNPAVGPQTSADQQRDQQ